MIFKRWEVGLGCVAVAYFDLLVAFWILFYLFIYSFIFLSILYFLETLAQVFSCEFCEISKNIFFTEHVRAIASLNAKN